MNTYLDIFTVLTGLLSLAGLLCLLALLVLAVVQAVRWYRHQKDSCPGRFVWSVGPVTEKTKNKTEREQSMKVTINNLQKIKLTLKPANAAGQTAELDGKPTWEKTSGDAEIVVADDGLSAELISGNPGDSTFLVTADADLGAGVENISDVIQLTVEGARAVNLGLTVGEPELK